MSVGFGGFCEYLTPVSPSSVACGATFPLEGEGYYGYPTKLRDRADLKAKQEVEHKKIAPPQKPSPLRGKVAPQATDEGGRTALTSIPLRYI